MILRKIFEEFASSYKSDENLMVEILKNPSIDEIDHLFKKQQDHIVRFFVLTKKHIVYIFNADLDIHSQAAKNLNFQNDLVKTERGFTGIAEKKDGKYVMTDSHELEYANLIREKLEYLKKSNYNWVNKYIKVDNYLNDFFKRRRI